MFEAYPLRPTASFSALPSHSRSYRSSAYVLIKKFELFHLLLWFESRPGYNLFLALLSYSLFGLIGGFRYF